MRTGISRISEGRDGALEVLATARRHGFEGVQLKPSQYGGFVADDVAFKEFYGELSGLACGGLIVYPGSDPGHWVDKVAPILAFGAAIGAGHICLCSDVYGSAASDEQVRDVASALAVIGESARRQELRISVHNHLNSLVETEDDIARLLGRLDPAVCGLTLDTAHAAKAGVADVSGLIVRFQEQLVNVHLKDIGSDGQFCALGQGTLDLDPILAALQEIGYGQWLIVDEETRTLGSADAIRIAAELLATKGVYH